MALLVEEFMVEMLKRENSIEELKRCASIEAGLFNPSTFQLFNSISLPFGP
jgi:hypothetical protein